MGQIHVLFGRICMETNEGDQQVWHLGSYKNHAECYRRVEGLGWKCSDTLCLENCRDMLFMKFYTDLLHIRDHPSVMKRFV